MFPVNFFYMKQRQKQKGTLLWSALLFNINGEIKQPFNRFWPSFSPFFLWLSCFLLLSAHEFYPRISRAGSRL